MRFVRWISAFGLLGVLVFASACTSTSNRLAVRGSERSDGVTSAVIERQHKSLGLLLYRETLAKLEGETDPHQQAAIIQDAFNDRDLFEFWYVQATLARCLHYGTVDTYLASQKSMFDLIAQDVAKRSEAPLRRIEGYAAARLAENCTTKDTKEEK